MNIPEILLAVCILILLWRVWRLEKEVGRVGRLEVELQQESIWRTNGDDMRPRFAQLDCVDRRVYALARALGYEWKRTEAKEGWERESVFADLKWASPPTELNRSVTTYYGSIPADTADRRKGDRRKPSASSLAAADMMRESEVAKAVKRAQKKPRRAH